MKEVLKEKFLSELIPLERIFFLKKAKEAVEQKGYPAGEDLFYYCYFLTLRERIRKIGVSGCEGYVRVLLVEGAKEIEEMVKMYEERLEKRKTISPDPDAQNFIEYFSE
ncbi:MAG TPA: hypothetical protein VLD55_08185 [Candidatus Sulfobium mesophilum]|nr:hypothetical protein [Candidatus Sulfobium mesophilum]